MVMTVERFNSRRKHEMVDGNSYHLTNYRESVTLLDNMIFAVIELTT